MAHIQSYKELRVYQTAIEAAMRIFALTKSFPVEERYSTYRPNPTCVEIGLLEHMVKLGESSGIGRTLLASSVTLRVRPKRRGFGWSSRTDAVTCLKLLPRNSTISNDHIIAQLVRMIDKPEQWSISKK